MANLKTIKEEKKKNRSGQGGKKRKKHLTGNKKTKTPKEDMKIAYTPLTDKEKRDAYLKLVRALKSGEKVSDYRWHGGGSLDFGDKH